MKTLAVAAALAFAAGLSAEVQKKDVDIKAPDGVSLRGTYFSAGRPGPAMLLLHQCNMDRHAWDGLAEDLAGNGFQVLTIDFRGFGESGPKSADPDQRAAARQKWPADVDAAFAFLTQQKGVDQSRIAVGGASCGVTQSSDLAARHHEIRALLLLSGMASDTAKAYIAGNPSLPVFGAASEGDTGAAKGIQEAVGASKNPKSAVKIYAGSSVWLSAVNPRNTPSMQGGGTNMGTVPPQLFIASPVPLRDGSAVGGVGSGALLDLGGKGP